tara:strand:+ start:11900 stop:12973 length:1074 start_codon:yes stop_codon:yes gene_type:complete
MNSNKFILLAFCFAASAVAAQSPTEYFNAGSSLQSWQDPGLSEVLEECSNPADPIAFPFTRSDPAHTQIQAIELPPVNEGIDGIVADNSAWEMVWAWNGNNTDGPIATEDGGLMFANNDASNVIRLSPDGSAEIVYANLNTPGALSRNKQGELFVLERGLNPAVKQLEPQRQIFADTYQGDPLDCVGGIVNDLVADAKGGVYFTITQAGFYYADPEGEITRYGNNVVGTNGIILSPEEDVLYVTNGPVVMAFDVRADGSLFNQREFGTLSSGGGDGMAVDNQGRLYVSTGSSVDVFATDGERLGTIPGPQGLHGVVFSGEDKRFLYAIVLRGTFQGMPDNWIIRIPVETQGYLGRTK